MGKIDISSWKEFRIGDFFEAERGKVKNIQPLCPGETPIIAAGAYNQGIAGMYEIDSAYENRITISCNGAGCGSTFYHPYKFNVNGDAITLIEKDSMSDKAKGFIACILNGVFTRKYSYEEKCSPQKALDEIVRLPSTPDGAPDWAYMESYMANLEAKVADSLTLLQAAKDAEKKKVDTREWGSFALGTLFNIVKGKRLTKAEMKSGETPFIGSSALNNGCTAMIGNDKNQHPENTITVCYNGSVGETFYQDQPYIASDDVNVLYPKFTMNRQIALFIVPLIKGVSSRYDYIDKWKKEAMETDKIYLPVDKTGQPDWAYMEEYMRKVEERVKKTINTFCVIRNIKFDC